MLTSIQAERVKKAAATHLDREIESDAAELLRDSRLEVRSLRDGGSAGLPALAIEVRVPVERFFTDRDEISEAELPIAFALEEVLRGTAILRTDDVKVLPDAHADRVKENVADALVARGGPWILITASDIDVRIDEDPESSEPAEAPSRRIGAHVVLLVDADVYDGFVDGFEEDEAEEEARDVMDEICWAAKRARVLSFTMTRRF